MPERGEIVGRVTTPDGEPVVEAPVMITGGPAHPDIAALTNERGEFRLTDLDPGEYTLLVNPEDRGPQTAQARVEPNRVTRLDLALPG
jgi:iron complex outermembrane receptor protein